MKTLLILLSLAGAAMICAAELPKFDVLNVGTKTYRGVKVTAIEPSGIRFTHESGAARAKFEELEPEVKSKFTFDPAAAKQFEDDRARQLRIATLKRDIEETRGKMEKSMENKKLHITAKVQQVLSDGILITEGSWMEPGFKHNLDDGKVICAPSGHYDGEWIEADVYPAGTFDYTTVLGARRTVKRYTLSVGVAVDLIGR